ncbi:ribonuclease P protein component [Candidatus Dependentiae bacterium]
MSKITRHISKFTESEVKKLFKKAKRVLRHAGLDILCAPAALEFGRILVVTPKKVGSAPERNLIRRRLKSLFYEEKLYEKKLDYIVIIKKKGINLPFNQLKEILTTLISQKSKKCVN